MENRTINEYLLPFRKWWWMIVLAIMIAIAASVAYTVRQPTLYQSHTQIMVGRDIIQGVNVDNNQLWLAEQLAKSYKNIAERVAVQEATMEALGMDWLPKYDVWVLPNTSLIDIYVTDTEPVRAQQVATELVTQLIQQSPAGREEEQRQQFLNQQLQLLEANITQTDEEIQRNSDSLLGARSAREISRLEDDAQVLENKLSRLRTTYGELLGHSSQVSINKIDVIEDASLPVSPLGNDLLINILLAAIGGFVLSASGAYLLELFDNSIQKSVDITEHLNTTIMGAIPSIDLHNNRNKKVLSFFGHTDAAAEAYRTLRTNLQFASVNSGLRTLLVTSPSLNDGKSTTVANLAAAFAHAGSSVAIIDVDLRRPTQHRQFNIYNKVGTTTALMSETWDFDTLMQETLVPNLKILPSGPLPPNPAELLGTEQMEKLLVALRSRFDILLIDSPPITSVADAIILSTLVDSILLVVRSGKTQIEDAKYTLGSLQLVDAPLAGVVLNDVKYHSVPGSYYGYDTIYPSNGMASQPNNRSSLFSFFGKKRRMNRAQSMPSMMGHPNQMSRKMGTPNVKQKGEQPVSAPDSTDAKNINER